MAKLRDMLDRALGRSGGTAPPGGAAPEDPAPYADAGTSAARSGDTSSYEVLSGGDTMPIRAEADVAPDPARADSRGPDGGFVGRVAADDDFSGETGAERRGPG